MAFMAGYDEICELGKGTFGIVRKIRRLCDNKVRNVSILY